MFTYSPILSSDSFFAFLDSTCSLLVVKGSAHLFMLHLLHGADPSDGRYHPPVVEDIDMNMQVQAETVPTMHILHIDTILLT